MAEIVVLGAGLGGTIMAYELLPGLSRDDHLTVIGQSSSYHFVPSNPWVAVGWRKPADIEVKLDTTMARKNIRFISVGASRVHPAEKRVEITDGSSVSLFRA